MRDQRIEAPKVRVAVTTVIARTAPTMTERTGAELRPRRLSRAKRRPAIPDTGSPEAMANLTTPDESGLARPRALTRCGACR